MLEMIEFWGLLGNGGSIIGGFAALKNLTNKPQQAPVGSQLLLSEQSEKNQSEVLATKILSAKRLHTILSLLNKNRNNKITISELAEFCGYEKAGDLQRCFDDLEELTYREQEHICFCLGINTEWLKHGKDEPFSSQELSIIHAEYYLHTIINKLPKEIIFVRSRGEDGRAIIILRINEFKYIFSPIIGYFSKSIWSDPVEKRQLKNFYILIKAIHNLKTTNCKLDSIFVKGFHIEEKDFDDLTSGEIYPGSIVNLYNDNWWDDFTDINHSYAYAESYEEKHGKNFIEAQKILKRQLNN